MTRPQPITSVEDRETQRITVGMESLDKFLGGGFADGQTIMLAGEPGVGKTTFLLQVANQIALKDNVLFVSGEESLYQLKGKANRVKTLNNNIWVSEERTTENIIKIATELKPKLLIVDSIQMLCLEGSKKTSGSQSVMRESLDKLIKFSKQTNIILIIIGHSTKTGLIAGLLTLQHMVDTTLYMTLGEEDKNKRILESKKNRFGESYVTWTAYMSEDGLKDKSDEFEKTYDTFKRINEIEDMQTISVSNREIDHIVNTSGLLVGRMFKSNIEWLVEKIAGSKAVEDLLEYEIVIKLKR